MVVLTIVFFGCAHKQTETASIVQPGRSVPQDIEAASSTDAHHGPADGNKEEFLEEDLEFLYEEAESGAVRVADPIEGLNRVMFQFNDTLYFWFLKPVAQTYRLLLPAPIRIGVKNFFHNLTTPVRLGNCVLQGKLDQAGVELTRFLMNSTLGILGFGNPAQKHPGLVSQNEDLGQTFGAYGIGSGFYIVWPFLGPSTLRDSVGFLGDRFLNPITYIEPPEASWGLYGYKFVNNTTFRIGDYEALKEASLDPYAVIRDAYIQNRKKDINE